MAVELEIMLFATQDEWEQWLEVNCDISSGVKVQIAKKNSGKQSVTYNEALEIALCFGWIDSRKEKLDDEYWTQRFTPRRKKSPWSAINREKAEKLIEEGKMRESGLREIENAKADSRWEKAYQPQSKATVPDDLQKALDDNPKAKEIFESLNSSNRFAILYRVQSAKKEATRQKRIKQFIEMLAEGKKIYD